MRTNIVYYVYLRKLSRNSRKFFITAQVLSNIYTESVQYQRSTTNLMSISGQYSQLNMNNYITSIHFYAISCDQKLVPYYLSISTLSNIHVIVQCKYKQEIQLQSAKLILVHPKCEIIFDSNINCSNIDIETNVELLILFPIQLSLFQLYGSNSCRS